MEKNKKYLLFGSAIFLCLLLLCLFKVSLSKSGSESNHQKITYLITPDSEASKEEVQRDLNLIKERLRMLFPKEKCTFEEANGSYYVTFPEEWMGESSEYLEAFLFGQGGYKIMTNESIPTEVVSLEMEDYQSIEYGEGVPETIKADYENSLGERYLKITFSEQVSRKLEELDLEQGQKNKISYVLKPKGDPYMQYPLYQDMEDASTFYLFYCYYDVFYDNETLLSEFLMTSPSLSYAFKFQDCVDRNASWQRIEEIDDAGAYQCNEDEFQKSYCTMVYYDSVNNMTQEEQEKTEKTIKNRMDLRREKYAYGYNRGRILVKTTSSIINQWFMETVIRKNAYQGMALFNGEKEIYLEANQLVKMNKENHIEVYLTSANQIDDYRKRPDQYIYLVVNHSVIAQTTVNEQKKDNILVFRDFCADDLTLSDDEEIPWYHAYYSSLIQKNSSSDDIDVDYSLEQFSYVNENGHLTYDDSTPFPWTQCYYEDSSWIQEKLRHINPKITAKNPKIYDLQINLHLNKEVEGDSEKYAGEVLRQIKGIYKTLEFDKSPYMMMTIKFYDTEKDERAEVSFMKWEERGEDKSHISFAGYLGNGRSQKHIDEILLQASQEKFFQQFILADHSKDGWYIKESHPEK